MSQMLKNILILREIYVHLTMNCIRKLLKLMDRSLLNKNDVFSFIKT